jgi:hypothetical protein
MSVTSVWAFMTASSLRLHEKKFDSIWFVTYVVFPSEVLVWFDNDEHSNSSRPDDALESMTRFEASRAARMSLLSLVTY